MSNPRLAPRWRTWLCGVGVLAAQILSSAAEARTGDLGSVTSFTIQLQNVGRDIDRLAGSEHDLIIVEPSVWSHGKRRVLDSREIARLKRKPDGTRRIVLAYMSVGEAEDYRDYWKADWRTARPQWIVSENCRWKGNYVVRFWDPEWKRILVSGRGSVLETIVRAGFDGVSLDRVDAFEELEHLRPDARSDMIALVGEIAGTARKSRPDFIVMAHNPENLVTSASFRKVVDGALKEDLLYGLGGKERRNPAQSITWSNDRLGLLGAEGKPVLVAEYISDGERADETVLELLEKSFLPGIFPRALDGSNPFQRTPAEAEVDRKLDAATCNGAWASSQ
jgi:cysteinyl-tRNA synthetase